MSVAERKRLSAPRRRRRLLVANLVASVLLGLALLAMALYLSGRHYLLLRTPSSVHRPLSEKTVRLLSELSDDLHIHALLRPGHPAAEPLGRLLDLYAAASPYVHVHRIDPDRDLALAEETVRRFAPPAGEAVVVATSDASRAIPAADLLQAGGDGGDALFLGEPLVSAAIYALRQPTPPAVYFLQGHGERSPADYSPDGCSRIADLLRQDNLSVDVLHLAEAKAVPPQAALLVVAGPAAPVPPQEIALLRDYIDRKGRVLFLLDALAPTSLDPLLREWNVALDQDAVIDPARSIDGRDVHVAGYDPAHPVSAQLDALHPVLHFPRSVRPVHADPAPDAPAATPLLYSSSNAWADVHPLDPAPQFNPQVDLPGPVPLAVAVERGPLPGLRTEIRPSRLVVIGDSAFAANAALNAGNPTLFLNAVNWLVDRPDHLGIPPAPLPPAAAALPSSALRSLALRLILLLPLAAALACSLPRLLRRARR